MATSLDAVVSQMVALGMPDISPHELNVNAGRWQRYGPKKLKAFYKIESRVSQRGREYFTGVFGFKGERFQLSYEGPQLTPAEIESLRQRRRLAEERDARKRERDIQLAADRAAETWAAASPDGTSPYLQRKGVEITGGWVRYSGPNVVVPMVRYDLPLGQRLKGIQIIRPDGEKRFTSGMEKYGCAAVLGLHQVGRPILICEGLATAASVWMAMEKVLRVVVAFDAGSLASVATIFSLQYPDSDLVICGDDDYLTAGNPGRRKAFRAAKDTPRTYFVLPQFSARGGAKLTDFNDLHQAEGLAEVRAQVRRPVERLENS